jgi:chorismate mutase
MWPSWSARSSAREGSPVFRPEREAQVINGLQAANPAR